MAGRELRSFRKDARGAALLELTVMIPLLLTIGLGVFEFGNVIYKLHLISTGVRDAARYLGGVAESSATETAAKNIAVTGIAGSGGTARVAGWSAGDVAVNYTSITNDNGSGNKLYNGGDVIRVVTVSTSFAYQPLGYMGYLGLGTITLAPSHQERVYGVR